MQEPILKPLSVAAEPEQLYAPFPLTDIQQAYWVGRRQDIELGGVTTHYYCEIDCLDLDLDRLRLSWQLVVARHDMLRAIITPDGTQRILETVPPYQIEAVDLRSHAPDTVNSRLRVVREGMSREVLPSDRWPLFDIRASLLPEGILRLHVNFETLIVDVRSWNLLFDDWSQFYRDPDLHLPPLELSFRDFVMAEVAFKDSDRYREAQTYWQSRLPTLPPPPELPVAKAPDDLLGSRFARLHAQLRPEIWERLKQSGLRRRIWPAVCLLAAFGEVLKVWSKSPSFTLNMTMFGRIARDPRFKGIVGDFTSSCLLAIDHDENATFEAQALLVQQRMMEDLKYSCFSGVQVIRELVKLRGRGFGAVMPVVFTSMLSADDKDRDVSPTDWLGEVVYDISQTPQVQLDHQVHEQKGKLNLVWDVVEGLLPGQMLQDMFNSYTGYLERLAIDEASWQACWAERAQKLVPPGQLDARAAANASVKPISTKLLHTPFEEQARRRPHQLAVVASNHSLTYEELHSRTNQIGHRLRDLGVRPNSLVGVVMEKGWEQVPAVLGVLAAGAAYLPIEAHLPKERIRYLLDHGEVGLVLTQPCFDEVIDWPEDIQRLVIDKENTAFRTVDNQPLDIRQSPEDLAYVIYTSGSTGLPKGVMIDHRGAVNTICDVNARFSVGPDDRALALSSLSFDLSVYDIFGLLAAGGTIVMPSADGLRDPSDWATLLADHEVTIWNTVPALMDLLAEYLAGRSLPLPEALRLVMMSGDWIPTGLPDRIRQLTGHVDIYSLGGATEASIWSILHPILDVDPSLASIPYGKPMVNQSVHVFNEALSTCPVWVPGQLYIGGVGLAKGYWRDQQRTDASFITHPRTRERLYRTGDLGRSLPDGNIEFLGREDSQVKIQGFRVELGEIEAALQEHPDVRAAALNAVGPPQGNRRLAAYVVPANTPGPEPIALRNYLAEKLPEYMVPVSYTTLTELPLSSNGKVDRKALPTSAEFISETAPEDRQVVTGASARIAAIAADVLKLKQVAPDANLLRLGATSVDMIRIVNRLENDLHFRPDIARLYRQPTVMEMARLYETDAGDGGEAAEPTESVDAALYQKFPLLRDPDERAAFKATQPGWRTDLDESQVTVLQRLKQPEQRQADYLARRSHRHFTPEPIPLASFGDWLDCLSQLQIDSQAKYRYASAGGLYPVQTYVSVKPERVEDLAGGIYYYDPVDHRLVSLGREAAIDPDIYDPLVNGPIFAEAAFGVFLIARLGAILPMYGERSFHYATLEAGLISQLLEMEAPHHGLGVCQIGNVDFDRVSRLFALEESHRLVHSLLGGGVDVVRAARWTAIEEGYDGGEIEVEEGEI